MPEFDNIINRKNTHSYKWDINLDSRSGIEILPFWVADMDFPSPKVITDALCQRAEYPVYGYTKRSAEFVDSIINWLAKRHSWKVDRDWLSFSPPGVIYAIHNLILLLTRENDKVIVQTPCYKPLLNVVVKNNRSIIENKLIIKEGKFEIDFDDLENKASRNAKLMVLCSPHNPTGRVWKREELERIGNICLENNIFLISDEIHADIIMQGQKHVHFPSLSLEIAQNSVCCISATKTFNISGLPHSTLIIANEDIRESYNRLIDTAQVNLGNIFSEIATCKGYQEGSDWLDAILEYIHSNFLYVKDFLSEKLPDLKLYTPEGTYMMWIDFSGLNKTEKEIQRILIEDAGVLLAPGSDFGITVGTWFRINVACPQKILEEGLNRIANALKTKDLWKEE